MGKATRKALKDAMAIVCAATGIPVVETLVVDGAPIALPSNPLERYKLLATLRPVVENKRAATVAAYLLLCKRYNLALADGSKNATVRSMLARLCAAFVLPKFAESADGKHEACKGELTASGAMRYASFCWSAKCVDAFDKLASGARHSYVQAEMAKVQWYVDHFGELEGIIAADSAMQQAQQASK